jgi:hypothetical protein
MKMKHQNQSWDEKTKTNNVLMKQLTLSLRGERKTPMRFQDFRKSKPPCCEAGHCGTGRCKKHCDKKKRALVVVGSPIDNLKSSGALEGAGFEVASTSSINAAVRLIPSKYDVIIVDAQIRNGSWSDLLCNEKLQKRGIVRIDRTAELPGVKTIPMEERLDKLVEMAWNIAGK